MKTSDFDYYLPEELIAQVPSEPRDSSKLLVFDRKSLAAEHRIFRDLTEYLKSGDVLVVNNTKVMPARLFGTLNAATRAEVLLLKRLNYNTFEVIMRPARRARIGSLIRFSEKLSAEVKGFGEGGIRILEFFFEGVFENILDETGEMPLPPYIKRKPLDKNRYQTVYCKTEGSAAAPTAGLHFTSGLLDTLRKKGVIVAEVLLRIGLGTFRPVTAENAEEHKMHREYYEIPTEAAEIINAAKREGRRVIAVGTTSVRTLESAAVRRENDGEKNNENCGIEPRKNEINLDKNDGAKLRNDGENNDEKNDKNICGNDGIEPRKNEINLDKNEPGTRQNVFYSADKSERGYTVKPGGGDTDIFIYPPYKFKITDALITNFHLPKSSLIMLVSAFAGYENTMNLYKTAVEKKYGFFSFGDAMLIL
jgi:S-adenosylmethionine:tRNA ribosyltransferase-isomerase